MSGTGKGRLFVVSTPIGNLEDITLRAIRVLKEAERVLAEDTRHSRTLFDRHGITTPLTALHDHNEDEKIPEILEQLRAGATLALITDAGTPTVSDPGFRLVRAVRAAGLAIEVVPGASAILTALVGAGLPTDAFAFLGFPPRKAGERSAWVDRVLKMGMTVVFYESPHRVLETLETFAAAAPKREAVVARELTKRYEEFLPGTFETILANLSERDAIKGEITVVVAAAPAGEESHAGTSATFDTASEIARLRAEGTTDRDIAKIVAKATGRKKSDVYAELVKTAPP